ncbi:VOC family protein, partial [Bacteroidota bacterium]
DEVIYDWEGKDEGLNKIPGADKKMRRVMLTKPEGSTSLFRYYFEAGMIELVEIKEHIPNQIFAGRGWGDQGIFELCFDVNDIGRTYENLVTSGAKPVLEPNIDAFDMGEETTALFGYVNDPDNLFVELVEIAGFRISTNFKFDLRKRGAKKPLSPFLLKMLRFAADKKSPEYFKV